MADSDLATVLSAILEDMPQVRVGTHLNHTNFLIGNKVFAFLQGEGVALKLPKTTIQALIEVKLAAPLVMGKRTMKEWAVIQHEHPEEYRQDAALFKESIAFVSSQT